MIASLTYVIKMQLHCSAEKTLKLTMDYKYNVLSC